MLYLCVFTHIYLFFIDFFTYIYYYYALTVPPTNGPISRPRTGLPVTGNV